MTPEQILKHLEWMYQVTGELTIKQFKDGHWDKAFEKYETLLDKSGVNVFNGKIVGDHNDH